jgi:hypothetical protein
VQTGSGTGVGLWKSTSGSDGRVRCLDARLARGGGRRAVADRSPPPATGLRHHTVARRRQIRAGRWRPVGPLTVALRNGPLTAQQHSWVVLLSAGPKAGLGGRTALEMAGLRGWESARVHVVVPIGRRVPEIAEIPMEVRQTRRGEAYRFALHGSPVRTPVEHSALDAAAWSSSPRACAGILAAVVRQRLTNASRLLVALAENGPIMHRPLMRRTLQDIAGGAQALSEIGIGRLCRRHGLTVTARQAI